MSSLHGDGEALLLGQFRQFYQEVGRWKRLAAPDGESLPRAATGGQGGGALVVAGSGMAAAGALVAVGQANAVAPSPATGVAPALVWQALVGLLNRQEAEVR